MFKGSVRVTAERYDGVFLIPLCLLQCLDTNLKQNEAQGARAESTRKGVN